MCFIKSYEQPQGYKTANVTGLLDYTVMKESKKKKQKKTKCVQLNVPQNGKSPNFKNCLFAPTPKIKYRFRNTSKLEFVMHRKIEACDMKAVKAKQTCMNI